MISARRAAFAALALLLAADAASAQTPDWEAQNLAIQQQMATYTLWMVVTGVISAILGAGSVIALVWTFNEQRKLAQNQARAIVELTAGRIEASSSDAGFKVRSWLVEIGLRNTGNTHAFNISTTVRIELYDTAQERTVVANKKKKGRIEFKPLHPKRAEEGNTRLAQIAPGESDHCSINLLGSSIDPELLYEMTDTFVAGRTAHLEVKVWVKYNDTFDREHEICQKVLVENIRRTGPTSLRIGNGHRSFDVGKAAA